MLGGEDDWGIFAAEKIASDFCAWLLLGTPTAYVPTNTFSSDLAPL